MKKEKSTTPSEFDLEKIRRFTEQELSRLAQQELPFCYQIGTDVLVGNYKVLKISNSCWRVVDNNNVSLFDFLTRKHAIFHCIALHKKQYKLADDIKEGDGLLNHLEFEAIIYRKRYKQAKEHKDDWGSDYYSARYIETMHKLAQTKNDLTKNLKIAKYIKL